MLPTYYREHLPNNYFYPLHNTSPTTGTLYQLLNITPYSLLHTGTYYSCHNSLNTTPPVISTHYSLPTTPYPLLHNHCSTHYSLVTTYCSPFSTHYSLPTALSITSYHYALPTTPCSLFTNSCSPFCTHYVSTHHFLPLLYPLLPTTPRGLRRPPLPHKVCTNMDVVNKYLVI